MPEQIITHYWGLGGLTHCGREVGMFNGHAFTNNWDNITCPGCLEYKPAGVATPTPLQEFHFTFGVQYRHEPHPHWTGAHPDGWLTVMAPDEDEARRMVRRYIGNVYAFSYDKHRFRPEYYPAGELARITPDGVIGSTTLVPSFGPSDPEYYGRDGNEIVAHRIEGKPVPGSEADAGGYAELGYDAVTVHRECAEEARALFESITEEDPRVMAFELDWNSPVHCIICEVSIT